MNKFLLATLCVLLSSQLLHAQDSSAAPTVSSKEPDVAVLAAVLIMSILVFAMAARSVFGPSRPESTTSNAAPASEASTSMSYCAACNVTVYRDARFCEKCGAPMQRISSGIPIEGKTAPQPAGSTVPQPANLNSSAQFQQLGSVTGQVASGTQLTADQRKASGMAVAGFSLGIASVFLYWIGIVPILGLIFSIIALATYRPEIHTGRWMAVIGLVLSALYTVMSLAALGHLK